MLPGEGDDDMFASFKGTWYYKPLRAIAAARDKLQSIESSVTTQLERATRDEEEMASLKRTVGMLKQSAQTTTGPVVSMRDSLTTLEAQVSEFE